MSTPNPTQPSTLPVLYADEYGRYNSLFVTFLSNFLFQQAFTTAFACGVDTSAAAQLESS